VSTAIIIPAYQAHRHLGRVLDELHREAQARQHEPTLLVVDDGSTDGTGEVASAAEAAVVRHAQNLGKGAAIASGLRWAHAHGVTHIVTADADGQHPADEILRLAAVEAPSNALVLGVRDLRRDGAPKANRFSNGLSNRFLSLFTGLPLHDTQCGLRRYPVRETLALHCEDTGYAFEAEVILRAARAGLPIRQIPIRVIYPDAAERLSHFHVVRDPLRIVTRVVRTLLEVS
jgi:glycosyltransferase involved in cell wall biosynthesis